MQKAMIRANSYRLLSVFLNILTNATQALKEFEHPSPAIAIAILLEEETCSVRIEDNGPGISAEILPKLFERFTSRTGGIGLGLTLAHDYVEHELHGTLHAESVPGKHTAFIVTLPTVS
jgi:signal transduction histidine kinase